MNSKRGWKSIDEILNIQWGKLAGDELVSLSARQQNDDAKRALPFRTVYIEVVDGNIPMPCDFCSEPITDANRSYKHDGLCVLCEIEVDE